MGVEMASTGEVACFGKNKYEVRNHLSDPPGRCDAVLTLTTRSTNRQHLQAYMKALLSTGFKLPKKRNIFLSLGPYKEKLEFLDSAQKLVNMGYNLFGTGYAAPCMHIISHSAFAHAPYTHVCVYNLTGL
jgi:hypothetical protein